MIRALSLMLALAVVTPAGAQVTIDSITPASGPAAGGTEVTIRGSGFSNVCPPITCLFPSVTFGGIRAKETRFVDENTIVAVTPEHLPGPVEILYEQQLSSVYVPNAFTFTGNVPASYMRLLLPIFSPPVRGAFGSEFHTSFTATAKDYAIFTWGLRIDRPCPVTCIELGDPMQLSHNDVVDPAHVRYTGNPGRFIYVQRNTVGNFAANLRVHDVTRAALNYGTEIPVVRDDEFTGKVALNGVPVDPRFRLTLRIYAMGAPFARVTVANGPATTVFLREGQSIYEPDYAELTIDQPEAGPFQVLVEAPLSPTMPPAPQVQTPVWAFITVTNNETQVISTITPQ